jgi:glycosyltransferase involved in cell wall biosynthesis
MRIAVNTRLLLPGKLEGIGWFTLETLTRITRANKEHEFVFLFDRPFSDEFVFSDNISPMVVSPEARHPLLWHTWFGYAVPRALKKIKADFFLSPDGFLSLSSTIPSFAVMHDINFIHHPEFHPWLTRKYYGRYFPLFARKAQRIATVSDYSKQDIIRSFGISPDKVDVVYNGAGHVYMPLAGEEKKIVKNELTAGNDYFLYVGSFHQRKNICRLLEAYDRFRSEASPCIKLVLAGRRMHTYPQMSVTLKKMAFRKDVIFAGHMDPRELQRVYGAAAALVYIPVFEGFGIPVLEAMNCDIPVITSNCTSLPEVAGNAALLVDPFSTRSVAEGMHRIHSDGKFRKALVERGRVRRTMYSWDRTADLLWKSIQKAID